MKSISVEEMKALEERAINEYGIPSIVLMENAGIRSLDIILEWYDTMVSKSSIVVICGRGNNGGDGFVVARHLINKGFQVEIFVLSFHKPFTPEAQCNLSILEKMKAPISYSSKESLGAFSAAISKCDFIVDAIFGTGLKQQVTEPIYSYIAEMNKSNKPIVSLDIPSGLHGDTGEECGIAVSATLTITMGARKKGLEKGVAPLKTGTLYVIDISLPRDLIDPHGAR
jgi:NAD(P)H-hydrate epimerase